MIYTIGRTAAYEELINNGFPKKMGRQGDYPGGSVWETREEAQKVCPAGFSVYGVLADWTVDTALNKEGHAWHDLLVDAPIVRLKNLPECLHM